MMLKNQILTFSEGLFLILSSVLALLLRLDTILDFGPLIANPDGCFNLRSVLKCPDFKYNTNTRMAKLLEDLSIWEFLNYFDRNVWYPMGLEQGHTFFPLLMIITYYLKSFLHMIGIPVNMNQSAAIIAISNSVLLNIFVYIWTRLCFNRRIANISCFLTATCPLLISTIATDSFDYEVIGLTMMVASIIVHLWANKKKTIISGVLSGIVLGSMALTWGAYIVVQNIISLWHILNTVQNDVIREDKIVFLSWYLTLSFITFCLPNLGRNSFFRLDNIPSIVAVGISLRDIFF